MPSPQPYTFLTFTSGSPPHAVEVKPDNPELWLTLCGMEHNRATGKPREKRVRRCWQCLMEIQRRGKPPFGIRRLKKAE